MSGLGEGGEEVVALVVDDNKGREIFDFDLPDGLHPEFRIFEHLHLPDAIQCEAGCDGGDSDRYRSANWFICKCVPAPLRSKDSDG